jgi:hypothetical protein
VPAPTSLSIIFNFSSNSEYFALLDFRIFSTGKNSPETTEKGILGGYIII